MSARIGIAVAVIGTLLLGGPAAAAGATGVVRTDMSATSGIEASAFAASAIGASEAPIVATAASGTFEAERALILQQTNALRAAHGLPPLRRSIALDEIAQDWSAQQARAGSMSHRPDFTAMYPAGWNRASENVAAGYAPGSVVDAWAASPGHRANMLSSATDIGIGVAVSSSGRYFYTQNFARYTSPPPTPPGAVSRIAGDDRFATSARISARSFPAGASTVYVASGADFPDALSAAALAGAAAGPLLLVQPSGVPAPILTELRRLGPDRIVVAGGSGVVSDAVLTTLRTITPNVERVFGPDRFATSRALALDAYATRGAPVVYLATGAGFADALAAGPAAAAAKAPVLLVAGSRSTIDETTLATLRVLSATRIVVIGGTGVVSAGLAASLDDEGFAVTRLAGADRYATAALVAEASFPNATASFLATGSGFADALSGGAAAGALGAPLLTMRQSCVPVDAHDALRVQDPDTLTLLGGFGSLLPAVAGFYRC